MQRVLAGIWLPGCLPGVICVLQLLSEHKTAAVLSCCSAELKVNPELACRKLGKRSVGKRKEAMAYFSIESAVALGISLASNVCVVAVFAKVLNLR